ncbi:MAG: serine hydrolase, partial [Gemmatimonadota bacterium]|nr:serine hydrolase [Gemmatimonadota bacterium]
MTEHSKKTLYVFYTSSIRLTIDQAAHRVTASGDVLALTSTEFSYNPRIVRAKAQGAVMGSEKLFTTAPSPENEGIPSRAILNFLQRIDAERICMHGFLLVRHNRIAAEGYWAPWTAERMHRIYSVSKSLVALAVGMMIDEGRLTLDDRVAEYF